MSSILGLRVCAMQVAMFVSNWAVFVCSFWVPSESSLSRFLIVSIVCSSTYMHQAFWEDKGTLEVFAVLHVPSILMLPLCSA